MFFSIIYGMLVLYGLVTGQYVIAMLSLVAGVFMFLADRRLSQEQAKIQTNGTPDD